MKCYEKNTIPKMVVLADMGKGEFAAAIPPPYKKGGVIDELRACALSLCDNLKVNIAFSS